MYGHSSIYFLTQSSEKVSKTTENSLLSHKLKSEAACRIQTLARGDLARQRVQGLRVGVVHQAAANLQRIVRGAQVRSRTRPLLMHLKDSHRSIAESLQPDEAAIRIQSAARRQIAYRRVQILQDESKHRYRDELDAACQAADEAARVFMELSQSLPDINAMTQSSSPKTIPEKTPVRLLDDLFFQDPPQKNIWRY